MQKAGTREAWCSEELEVHRGPSEPSRKGADLDLRALQHSETLAHHRYITFVKVAERGRLGIANNAIANQLTRITPLLNRYLSNSWQGFAILVKRRRIAHDENRGVSGHRKIFLNAHPSRAICFDVQPLARRRGCYTCSPDHRFACDALARDYDTVRVDVIDAVSEPDFDSQLLESLLRGFGETIRKRPQNTGRHIDEHNSC